MSIRNRLFTLRLSLEDIETIKELATALHVTSSEAVRRAVHEQRKAAARQSARAARGMGKPIEFCLRCNTSGKLVWCRNAQYKMRVCTKCEAELGAERVRVSA